MSTAQRSNVRPANAPAQIRSAGRAERLRASSSTAAASMAGEKPYSDRRLKAAQTPSSSKKRPSRLSSARAAPVFAATRRTQP